MPQGDNRCHVEPDLGGKAHLRGHEQSLAALRLLANAPNTADTTGVRTIDQWPSAAKRPFARPPVPPSRKAAPPSSKGDDGQYREAADPLAALISAGKAALRPRSNPVRIASTTVHAEELRRCSGKDAVSEGKADNPHFLGGCGLGSQQNSENLFRRACCRCRQIFACAEPGD